MKTILKSLLFSGLFISSIAYTNAQVYVRVRPTPPRPHVVIARPPAPSPRHVWVAEHWQPHRQSYRWQGGYWAAPPRPRAVWVPGHWSLRRRGYVWMPGYWR
ncbi:BcpO-related WXXGXW repeat protein [Spirosoma sp. HMF4905]|uniref:BcpO-related WXXGXW repeat protein n=1 Tax=Spirosoma arboris TaxID=2682092 RepID=A0A7K1SGE4_9BACT|nr:YXWGXW repeat-containing protein [Spirosoma arboris]MVM32646.1 BcpO-related WXXGXW repeat protein [Spirosoma arboris]